MPSDMPQKRSAAGSAEHEQHYSTDDDALAGRALGSTSQKWVDGTIAPTMIVIQYLQSTKDITYTQKI